MNVEERDQWVLKVNECITEYEKRVGSSGSSSSSSGGDKIQGDKHRRHSDPSIVVGKEAMKKKIHDDDDHDMEEQQEEEEEGEPGAQLSLKEKTTSNGNSRFAMRDYNSDEEEHDNGRVNQLSRARSESNISTSSIR